MAGAKEEGCNQGIADTTSGTNSEVILDFGGQFGNLKETESINGVIRFTFAQIEAISEEFAAGYFSCVGTNTQVTLGIGTNNSKEAVSSAGGKAWAALVKVVAAHVLENKEETKYVAIWGADDLEVGFSTGGKALAWAKGYNKTPASPYIDFGDAAGCPQTTHKNGKCTGGMTGWTQNVEVELSWHLVSAWNAPEIY